MTQPNPDKKRVPADDSVESRRRSGTRRVEDAEPVSVPRPPRLPSLGMPFRVDPDHVPTQPENDVPSSSDVPTLAAPPAPEVPAVDDDDDRDTIPSPAPEQ